MIDPHVHCRDWGWSYKETIAHALMVAERVGLDAIFDMPNIEPEPIITRALAERRLADADRVKSPVFYGLYIGLTPNPEQIREAVKAWREFFPRVVGLKMFAGRSVGNLAVIEEAAQQLVYQTLAEEGFDGVLAVHCEKEKLMKSELWNPQDARTHSFARPEGAEIESIRDQYQFALLADFRGTLHIPHVSCSDSVQGTTNIKRRGKIKITCGITPHHCTLCTEDIPLGKEGLLYKVNPPLKDWAESSHLFVKLGKGEVDWIETDHAPHTLKDKYEKQMSGFPGLPYYPHFINRLRKYGFSEREIQALAHDNIERVFGFKIPKSGRKPELDLHKEYEVDVYESAREAA